MAGVDDGFTGEARLTPGFTVGLLAQEPQLDPTKDVLGNVMDGVGEPVRLLDRYNEVMAMWADPDADYDKIGAQQAELEDKIDGADAWDLERNVEIAMDALRCPPGDADVTTLSRWRAAPRRAVPAAAVAGPTCCCSTSPPTTSTPSRVAWLERFLQEYTRHRRRRHPRPLLPRQRRRAGSSSSTVAGASRSRATTRRGSSRSRSGSPARRRATRPGSAPSSASSSGCAWRPKARQAKGKARLAAYEKLLAEAEGGRAAAGPARDPDPRRATGSATW